MSTREQGDHVEIKVDEFGGHEPKRQNFPHDIKLICSPNLKYIATLNEKDESILIWPVLGNESYLNADKSFKVTELDTNEDSKNVYKLEELSDDALIVLISETSCIMYDTNKEQHVEIPHLNEQVLQTSEIYVSFLKNGYFAFISESKLYLYSVITKDPRTCLQCKNRFGFNIELNQCTLSRDGKLLIGDGFFKSQWDIDSEKFEIQYPIANDFVFNKYENLQAVWHNRDLTLKIYSAKTGIKILSREIEMNYKNQNNEYFQISFMNLGERLLISHFTNSKMQNYLIDPYSEKNATIKLDLYDELNSKYVGFIPKRIFENKVIGIVNRKVLIHNLFQEHYQNYLREEIDDKNNIRFLSIMKEILDKMKDAKSEISSTLKVDIELKGQIKGKHMNLVNWEFNENSDGKMELSARKGNINLAKLNVTDIYVEKNSLKSLNILTFKLLTNDELMVITKWYHSSIKEFTIIVAFDDDKSIRMKYFFDTNYLKNLLKVCNDLLEKCKMDSEMDKDLLKMYKDLFKVCKDLLEKRKKDSEIDNDLLKCKIVSEKLFSVDYFKFILKNFDFGFFEPNNTLSNLIKDHINDTSFFALYAQNLLEAAISEQRIDLVDQVFDKCMKLIKNDPAEINVLKIISSLSIKVHETYPDYFNRFISQTSLLLSPSHVLNEPIVYTSDPHLHPHAAEPYMFKLKKELVDKQFTVPAIHFVVPLAGFSSYDTDFSFWKEIFGRSKSNGFLIFNWKRYVFNLWNCFDFGSLTFPVAISIYWLINGSPPLWAPSLACLFLDIKFLFYLRAFEYFGVYFAIIVGVAQTVFSYLIVLGIIILAFTHALYILLQEDSKNMTHRDKVHRKIIEVKNDKDLTEDKKPVISNLLLELTGLNIKSEESEQEEANLKLDNDILKKLLELVKKDKETE
ncbi:10082_t:CDS:2 [Dentiscutata erythropus]|uniref:10082_t:CDS:1 n=1 Tax=Dentiscutata erythropus TaxID=1348616 RepID=A0A9N8W4R8_9GLOM|nr:10082_t:CDS:2 [Dentiscutata erythropus]